FLCVLNGAIMFMAGIMKRVNFPANLVSIKASSYIGVSSTGDVRLGGLTSSVKGKKVIVFEDIVDTGNTVMALKKYLLDEGAADVRICTMLLKPEVYKQPQKIDYVGAEIPNEFIVGYGLDYDELGRNLNEIYILER
ncbi:MAG: hypoxanthine phosphoribosyltransferase, partial [Bacteroidales bacterium]|nr:hypoxanthine phosphoribosyltransferase [Candidatus Cryptobacteroides equifaecalis]